MKLSKLISKFKSELKIENFKDVDITGIESDSRLVKPFNLFFALRGLTVHGIQFLETAVRQGAVAVVCDKKTKVDSRYNDIVIIKHKDPRHLLGQLLKTFYKAKPKHILAVTGTSGKTSIVEFVRQTIENLGKKSASIGTLGVNYKGAQVKEDMLTMRELVDFHKKLNFLKEEKGIDYVAIEATSQGMHQRRMEGVDIEVGAFTNLSQDHLDYHKNFREYLKCKMILFDKGLKEGSKVVLNADIPEYEKLRKLCEKRKHKILTYGRNGDIKLVELTPNQYGQEIVLEFKKKKYVMNTSLIGAFQAMNLLCALGMIISVGAEKSIEKIIKILEKIEAAEGRMHLAGIKKNGGSIYIDYSHKPDALEKALNTMRKHLERTGTTGKLCVLFGCGGDRDPVKRPIMGKIACDIADIVIVTEDNSRSEDPAQIRKDILRGCNPDTIEIKKGREFAIEKAIGMLGKNDVLLLAGKGHEKYIINRKGKFYFNEFEIVERIINK